MIIVILHLTTKRYKNVCLVLDGVPVKCTLNDDGQFADDHRITWTAPNHKKAVESVKLAFNDTSSEYTAAIADLKIFYKIPGRYRSLKVDKWVDGSCIKTVFENDYLMTNHTNTNGLRALVPTDEVTIWKGKQHCYQLGFAYAMFSESGVYCHNTIRGKHKNDKCTSTCTGNSDEWCGSDTHSNVFSTTGVSFISFQWPIFGNFSVLPTIKI